MQINAVVPSKPLTINKGLLFPQGFISFFLIIKLVTDKLNIDLKKLIHK